MIEVEISKPVQRILAEVGEYEATGYQEFTVERANELEQIAWLYYESNRGTPQGRAMRAFSRNLATALECERSIQDVEHEIVSVLTDKWDDEDAVETHVQLMVHRGWDRVYALPAIERMRPR